MIAAIVTAYRRPELLRRLLSSLRSASGVARVYVVNNAPELIPDKVLTEHPLVTVLTASENFGTAGGLALGMETALSDPAVRYLLLCDDDAVVHPDAPEQLRAALWQLRAGATVPLILRDNGSLGWFPGLLEPEKWKTIKREPLRPEAYLQACGSAPAPFSWAPWPVMLVSREAVSAVGLPRRDLWYHGADIEYSLRLSARFACYLVPDARSSHLPPTCIAAPAAMHARECFGLQNQFYMCTRLTHCRRALRHLPGNAWRTWRRAGGGWSALRDIVLAMWWGAGCGQAATSLGYDQFFRRWNQAG